MRSASSSARSCSTASTPWPSCSTCDSCPGSSQTGAVVGLLALVVIFQPELRRALERIGRVGSLGWAFSPSGAAGLAESMARTLSRTAFLLSSSRTGALIVIERETGLEDAAETGVMLHADLSGELLASIFAPRTALHDGAVIIRAGRCWRRASSCPCPRSPGAASEPAPGTGRPSGITEQTDAVVIVVSEETGSVSLVQRGRMSRDLDEERLRAALVALLRPAGSAGRAAAGSPRWAPRSSVASVRGASADAATGSRTRRHSRPRRPPVPSMAGPAPAGAPMAATAQGGDMALGDRDPATSGSFEDAG